MIHKVLSDGVKRTTRNGTTYELFGERLEFDLSLGFPLLTTKKMFWRGVVEELLWFLRGSTDVTELQEKGVHIWDANSSREFLDALGLTDMPANTIGAGYGYQWRSFGGDYPRKNGYDQLKYVLQELRSNPSSRRIFLSAWNPLHMNRTALMPCHVSYNFYVSPDGGLTCQMYMRSNDLVAGCPFNIASCALLTHILAAVTGLVARRIIIVIGNAHVYTDHVEAARVQLQRTPFIFPRLQVLTSITSGTVTDMIHFIENLRYDDIVLTDYTCHARIPIKMIP